MVDIAAAKFVLDALRLGYEAVSGGIKLSKKDKEKIAKEAARLVKLATDDDVDKLIAEPRRKIIDYMTGAADTTVGRGRPPAVAHKKKAAKATRDFVPRKKAKKKK